MENKTLEQNTSEIKTGKRVSVFKITVVVLLSLIFTSLVVFGSIIAVKLNKNDVSKGFSFEQISAKALDSTVEVYSAGNAGTGVIYSLTDGGAIIITNRHVVKTNEATVNFKTFGTSYPAELLAYSDYHDIALIKTDTAPPDAKPVKIGSGQRSFGEEVLVAGNALGKGLSVFEGIVSMPSRNLVTDEIDTAEKKTVPVIQISAPVNSGCSGGGLFDRNGELVGINTYQSIKVSDEGNIGSRPVDGMSYSVPIDIVESIAKQAVLQADRKEVKLLTARISGSTNFLLKLEDIILYLEKGENVTVSFFAESIESDTVLKKGDILKEFGNIKVNSDTSFGEIIAEYYRYENANDASSDKKLIVVAERENTVIRAEFSNKRLKR